MVLSSFNLIGIPAELSWIPAKMAQLIFDCLRGSLQVAVRGIYLGLAWKNVRVLIILPPCGSLFSETELYTGVHLKLQNDNHSPGPVTLTNYWFIVSLKSAVIFYCGSSCTSPLLFVQLNISLCLSLKLI